MASLSINNLLQKRLRRNWPKPASPSDHNDGVAIVFVSYNTLDLTAALLFSIFRVLGRTNFTRIVAVDNNSTDGSKELLEYFSAQGMLDLISNSKQNYHGPAINQAISYLASMQSRVASGPSSRYIWIVDSDVILLRSNVISDAVNFLKEQEATAVGQFQYDALPEGYAHISSLLIDPVKAWRRSIAPFDNTGAPAANFQQSIRAHGLTISDFPYRTKNYLLHLTRGTLKSIRDHKDQENAYYQWAKTHATHHYHGNPDGQLIHERFLEIFNREIPELTAETLLAACVKSERIKRPVLSDHEDAQPFANQ